MDKHLANKASDPDLKVDLNLIGITSKNRQEWMVTDLACNLLGFTSVALYETIGNDMVNLILKETELRTVFGSEECLFNILEILSSETYNLKTIVCFDSRSKRLESLAADKKVEVLYYQELMQEYHAFKTITSENNKVSDIYTISYTSGTSGDSKGVLLSN